MALVYFGYLRADESQQPTAQELSIERTRRWVALGLAFIFLVAVGLIFGPLVVIAVAVMSAIWWAWAARADRRRDQRLAAKQRDR